MANAQVYIGNDHVKIARHDSRRTAYRFTAKGESSAQKTWGVLFEKTKPEVTSTDIVHIEELPRCSKPEVVLDEVGVHTPGTESTDILYYSGSDPAQTEQARKYSKRKEMYQTILRKDPQTGHPPFLQSFARVLNLSCLPTRFRFVYVGSKRYMEFRKGNAAWEDVQ